MGARDRLCSKPPGHAHSGNPATIDIHDVLRTGGNHNVLFRSCPTETIDGAPMHVRRRGEEPNGAGGGLGRQCQVLADRADGHRLLQTRGGYHPPRP